MEPTASPCRIVVVTKAPQPGLAKTRLIPALGAQGAATLAARMLQHAWRIAVSAEIGNVELYLTPGPDDPAWQGIELPPSAQLSCQPEGDLGDRMSWVAERVIGHGDWLIMIGTDCPALTTQHLQEMQVQLQHPR